MSKFLPILLVGAAVTAAPAFAGERLSPEMRLQKLLDGRVAGKPVDCINLSLVDDTQVINGRAIVYRVGGRLYVNEPRSGASQLDDDDVMVTRTFGSQLCSIDTVHFVDSASRFPRGFVQLGKFVPYTKVKKAS